MIAEDELTGLLRVRFVILSVVVVRLIASRRNNRVEGGSAELVGEKATAARGDQYNQQNAKALNPSSKLPWTAQTHSQHDTLW